MITTTYKAKTLVAINTDMKVEQRSPGVIAKGAVVTESNLRQWSLLRSGKRTAPFVDLHLNPLLEKHPLIIKNATQFFIEIT